MRAWGIIKSGEHKLAEAIVELSIKKRSELPLDIDFVLAFIGELTHELDIERPVIVKKHLLDIKRFGHVTFKPSDFIETVDFDRFEVSIIS